MSTVHAENYQRWQATRTADADTDYCPECGRPWQDSFPMSGWQSEFAPWSAWLLVVVGLYLLVSFGPRAIDSVDALTTTPGSGPALSCLSAGTEQSPADCDPRTARAVTALALVWIVAGFGSVARRTVLPRSYRRSAPLGAADGPSPFDPLGRCALGVWTLFAAICQSSLYLILLLGCSISVSRLSHGVPLSEGFVAQAVDRAVRVVGAVLQGQ